MKIVYTINELLAFKKELIGTIGLVPTMGALHNGHLSLIRKAKEQNDAVIVSIFVNPAQFGPNEDFNAYPRKKEADLKICKLCDVDIVFMPDASQIYNEIEPTIQAPASLAYILEGQMRPGHFDGVLRVVLKLLNLTMPTKAYFGKKDAQQLFLIENMVKTLFLPVEIVPMNIIREDDGLAISSRNIYLSHEERNKALLISLALKNASQAIMKGERDARVLEDIMSKTLCGLDVEYTKVLSRDFYSKDVVIIGETILLIAARVGKTRLIDNLWI